MLSYLEAWCILWILIRQVLREQFDPEFILFVLQATDLHIIKQMREQMTVVANGGKQVEKNSREIWKVT